MKRYYEWLIEQKDRDCVIGDLAGDTARISNFPKDVTNLNALLAFMRSKRASREALGVAVESWFEYLGQTHQGEEIAKALETVYSAGYTNGFDAASNGEDSDAESSYSDNIYEIFNF